jgi:hypothetical protein
MDARRSAFAADGAAAFPLISAKLRANAVTVLRRSADDGCTPHEAALRVAQERVLTAMRLRGRVPAATPWVPASPAATPPVPTSPDLRPVPARPSARPVEQPA